MIVDLATVLSSFLLKESAAVGATAGTIATAETVGLADSKVTKSFSILEDNVIEGTHGYIHA